MDPLQRLPPTVSIQAPKDRNLRSKTPTKRALVSNFFVQNDRKLKKKVQDAVSNVPETEIDKNKEVELSEKLEQDPRLRPKFALPRSRSQSSSLNIMANTSEEVEHPSAVRLRERKRKEKEALEKKMEEEKKKEEERLKALEMQERLKEREAQREAQKEAQKAAEREEARKKAIKDMIIYSLIGLLVVFLLFVMLGLVAKYSGLRTRSYVGENIISFA
eukprot:TRINITY_DN6362_c0_g1_i1.p1 TRINITY_DN6362_c0_g1~~TRINITY_DN6362_c0_g1_i1.p1  ORF type:complete len:218 (+),score=62.05 TRINITY_DN6362_c0_g1_i1:93-746(+)